MQLRRMLSNVLLCNGMGFPQPLSKEETLLNFLGYRAGVKGPEKVLHQVNSKEYPALDVHRGSVSVWRRVVDPWFPEVDYNLFCHVHIQRQFADFVPVH